MQRITRLTPLSEVLALIDERIAPVRPLKIRAQTADGKTLAADLTAPKHPSRPIALRDGFAVEAAAIADAGSYAPVPFSSVPARIEVGAPMPSGTDAILPFDAVVIQDGRAAAIASVAPGEGVLPTGGDVLAGTVLRRGGNRMRAMDSMISIAAGIEAAAIREPKIMIVMGDPEPSLSTRGGIVFLLRSVFDCGGTVTSDPANSRLFDDAFADTEADAIIAGGGTGSGERDRAVEMLAQRGSVEVYGVAISPGETTALGFVGTKPVLLVPGRLDAAIAVWILIGRHLLAKLAGGRVVDRLLPLPLKRKVASSIGLTELIPVRFADGMAEPLASGYLSLTALAHSDGFIVVPAESEGFAEGTQVAVTPWP